jgi:hypothetical protein
VTGPAAVLTPYRELVKARDDLAARMDWSAAELPEFNAAQDKLAARVPALLAALEAALKHHRYIDRGGPDLRPVCSCSRLLWPCSEVADVLAALAEGERGND